MIFKTKIIAVVGLSIILTVGSATFVVLEIQKKKIIQDKFEDIAVLADIIEMTIDDDMKHGNAEHIQTALERIGKTGEVLHLRIISQEGKILKSANPAELGMSLQNERIPSGELLKNRSEVNQTSINYFRDIPNRSECHGCHNSTEKNNGTVQITLDTSRSHATILSIKRLFLFSIGLTVLLVSGILSILFSRMIVRPAKNLLSAIHDVESGNWNAIVKVESNTELQDLGASFNKMIGEINKLYTKDIKKERELSKVRAELEHKSRYEELNKELKNKIEELETANKAITSLSQEVKGKNIELEKAVERLKKINGISRILSSIIDPDELLKVITSTAADLLNSEKAVLHLHKNTCKTLLYRKGSGLDVLDKFPLDPDPQLMDLLSEGTPFFGPGPAEAGGPGSRLGVPLEIKSQVIGALIVEKKSGGADFTTDDLSLFTTLSNHAVIAIDNAWLYRSVKHNYFSTIQSLVNALEASDKFTKGHSERVRHLSLELGRHIGLDFRELEILEQASILHDIGKIGIESFILQKQGKLTPSEYRMIKAHPLIGEEILEPIDTLVEVRQIIIQHHERFDGKGYPYGLKCDELSLKAKILSVVDSFDAMMSDRPYRKAISIQKIKEEVIAHSGTQFDPYVVESFIELLDLKGEDLLLSSGYFTFQTLPKT
jgi:HD-GYP domain-containing protein (c-di-GMP phosphodiesterase class II)